MNRTLRTLTLLALLCAVPVAALAADAVIASVEGRATLMIDGKRVHAVARAVLPPGGRVLTGAGATVLVLLADGSKIRVGENSSFVFEDEGASATNLRLLKGVLTGWIRHLGDRRLNIRTPSAVASVRGTILTVLALPDGSSIELYEGAVWVTDRFGRSTQMSPFQRADVRFASGLTGTASLPPNAPVPPEPATNVPPPAAGKGAQNGPKPAPAPGQAPPPETASQLPPPPETAPAPAPIAAPPPTQQTTVVSPSAP